MLRIRSQTALLPAASHSLRHFTAQSVVRPAARWVLLKRHASSASTSSDGAESGPEASDGNATGLAIAVSVLVGGVLLDYLRNRRLEAAKFAPVALPVERVASATVKEEPAVEEAVAETSSETVEDDDQTVLTNWSNTHSVAVPSAAYSTPTSVAELEDLVKQAHEAGTPLRPIGSALSPNGVGFHSGMVNLALLDKLVSVDTEKNLITIQAGARIDQLVDYLRPHGLTLPTYASIREQQVGGFTQTGAHGTGVGVPSVDGLVKSLRLVTPGMGTLELSEDDEDPVPFHLARCGLGSLGVVAELTLKVVPAHKLVEKTFVSTRNEIEQNHMDWVKKHQHLRYMWIPHTENVVVVCSDPEGTAQADNTLKWLNEKKAAKTADAETEAESDLERLSAPYQAIFEARGIAMPEEYSTAIQLRDHLYNLDPLNTDFVKEINAASAEFWKRNEGVRVDWSDQILGFDCGGEQWVDESCFKVPELSPGADADSKELPTDLKHTEAILSLISSESLPAHEPIEQRWSLGTASPISPSFAKDASVFSWVGIIMYLPPASDPANTVKRHLVTAAFEDYVRKVYAETKTSDPSTHLAKIEFKEDNMDEWRERFRRRMGDENWARLVEFKRKSDPNGILSNDAVAKLIR